MKASQMVTNRQKWATKLVGTARAHRYRVKVGMRELLGVDHAGAAAELMAASADRLEAATLTMIATDKAHNAEIEDDAAAHVECADAAVMTRSVLMGLRDRATTLFGTGYVKALGYEGSTSEDPEMLRDLAARILKRIDGITQPHPKIKGMGFDAGAWKGKIRVALSTLSKSLDRLCAKAHTAERTIAAKHRAIADYDAVFFKSATLIGALLSIAGEEDLAERVYGLYAVPVESGKQDDPFNPDRETIPSSIPAYASRRPKWQGM